MKKVMLVLLILVISITVMLISAQDETMPCSQEEFVESASVLSEGFLQYADLIVLPDEPTASDLAAAVVVADAFAYGYWEGFYEAQEEGVCDEVVWLGYTSGLLLDEMLITLQLSALAVYEAEMGEVELAEALLEHAERRAVVLEETATEIGDLMTAIEDGSAELDFEFAECTEEELAATYEGLDAIYVVYEEFGGLVEEAEGTDLSALIVGYTELSTGYWEEFFPVVPECAEAQDEAFSAGLILDESLIIVASYRLAELEGEMGDAEIAEALLASAEARLEDLTAFLEAYYSEE